MYFYTISGYEIMVNLGLRNNGVNRYKIELHEVTKSVYIFSSECDINPSLIEYMLKICHPNSRSNIVL